MAEIEHIVRNYIWCMVQCAIAVGEQTSNTVFVPSSTEDFLKSEPFGRVLFEIVLGEWL